MKRRTWLFVPGADEAAHRAAARSGADVLVLELEDFTPAELRPKARRLSQQAFEAWRKRGAVAAVRVNPLETCGRDDLRVVMLSRPDIVMMSKVESARQVEALAAAAPGVELVPNVETAAGLLRTYEIARASRRVSALLVASEDMVASLGTERSRSGQELAYVRARFLRAAADARYAKRLGYRMKSLVDPRHARPINAVFTPSAAELRKARRIVEAFELARAAGRERARVGGALIEVPIYAAAKRLLAAQ